MRKNVFEPIFFSTVFAASPLVGRGTAAASKTSATLIAVGPHSAKAEATPIVSDTRTGARRALHGSFSVPITIYKAESWTSSPTSSAAPFLARAVFSSGSRTMLSNSSTRA